jgi:Large ribosomal RNA subunit accumulation protein YceD
LTDLELSRPVSLSKIGPRGFEVTICATPKECARLAARMDIPGIQSLECFFRLVREDDGVSVFALGRLQAHLTRVCVVSLEEFETTVTEEFELRFVPAGMVRDDPNPNQTDEIPYETNAIDLGEAAAEQLGLALDPYPRMDGAAVPDFEEIKNQPQFSVLSSRLGSSRTRH